MTKKKAIYKSLKTNGTPIGMFPNIEYEESHIYISSPTSLYLFSDGMYEITNQEKQLLGLNNFIKIIEDNYHDLEDILKVISSYNNLSYFNDDLSIMKIDFIRI